MNYILYRSLQYRRKRELEGWEWDEGDPPMIFVCLYNTEQKNSNYRSAKLEPQRFLPISISFRWPLFTILRLLITPSSINTSKILLECKRIRESNEYWCAQHRECCPCIILYHFVPKKKVRLGFQIICHRQYL